MNTRIEHGKVDIEIDGVPFSLRYEISAGSTSLISLFGIAALPSKTVFAGNCSTRMSKLMYSPACWSSAICTQPAVEANVPHVALWDSNPQN
jgi:hypothetical protein